MTEIWYPARASNDYCPPEAEVPAGEKRWLITPAQLENYTLASDVFPGISVNVFAEEGQAYMQHAGGVSSVPEGKVAVTINFDPQNPQEFGDFYRFTELLEGKQS